MIANEPYFMKNEKWYFHDDTKDKYALTPEGKKNKHVVKSYKEFYTKIVDGNGYIWDV